MANEKKVGRPEVSNKLKRKPRTIKVRDGVYNKLRELGGGSYAKGVEFLVYNYTEVLDPERETKNNDKGMSDGSCSRKSIRKIGGVS